MALSEEQVIDKIEFVGDHRIMQIREATVIKRDGVEISRSYHRRAINAGATDSDGVWLDSDTTAESVDIQAIAVAGWTAEVKSAAHLAGALQALEAANGTLNANQAAVDAIQARIDDLEAGADAELPDATAARDVALAKRDTVQGNIDLI